MFAVTDAQLSAERHPFRPEVLNEIWLLMAEQLPASSTSRTPT
jgi:hypothetical protein